MELDWKFCVNVGLLGLLIYFIASSLKGINENFASTGKIHLQPRPFNRDTETNINLNTYVPNSNQYGENLAMKTNQSINGPNPVKGTNPIPGPPQIPESDTTLAPTPVQETMHDGVNIVDGTRKSKPKEKFDVLKFTDEPEQNYDNVFYLNGTADEVKQYNTYTNNWNTANFKSNVLDVRHFYKRNAPNSIHPDADLKPPVVGKLPAPGERRCFTDSGDKNGREVDLDDPDVWKYKNEMPMNGGQFLTGVYGFDTLDGLYATYDANKKLNKPNPADLGSCGPNTSCNAIGGEQCQDDIRNGLGTPGRKWAARN